MENTTENTTSSELSVETRLIVQRLASLKIGEFIAYAELSEIIGRDIQYGARHVLESARRIVQRENKILLECVYNQGLKRLDDIGIVGSTQCSVLKISNLSKRGVAKVLCLHDMSALPPGDKASLNARISIMAMVAHVTKTKNVQLIESKVAATQERLPLMKTIEAFMG
jgi:hypothetical protein